MNKVFHMPFELRGVKNIIEVVYKANDSVSESGFDTLTDLPFDPSFCLGYPAMYAYVKDMKSTGYRRVCGWIQLVHREYYSSCELDSPDEDVISVDTIDASNIYSGYGSPAEIYDAPCYNLNGNAKGKWTAYTYLVDAPCRMNGYKMIYLAGFKWGYFEDMKDGKPCPEMQNIAEIDITKWRKHIPYMKAQFPRYDYAE